MTKPDQAGELETEAEKLINRIRDFDSNRDGDHYKLDTLEAASLLMEWKNSQAKDQGAGSGNAPGSEAVVDPAAVAVVSPGPQPGHVAEVYLLLNRLRLHKEPWPDNEFVMEYTQALALLTEAFRVRERAAYREGCRHGITGHLLDERGTAQEINAHQAAMAAKFKPEGT